MRTELACLQQLFPKSFPWAEDAFGTGPPDAINLWIGNEYSISSMHKDHYENLFYVCSGEKMFTLCPPANTPFLYETEFPSATFVPTRRPDSSPSHAIQSDDHSSEGSSSSSSSSPSSSPSSSSWAVQRDEQEPVQVRWIEPDVHNLLSSRIDRAEEKNWNNIPDETASDDGTKNNLPQQEQLLNEFPLLRYTHPKCIRVKAGELLYLPALWYHRVTQSCETVGVNYWYDMKFDSPSWCYFHLLQQLQEAKEGKGNHHG